MISFFAVRFFVCFVGCRSCTNHRTIAGHHGQSHIENIARERCWLTPSNKLRKHSIEFTAIHSIVDFDLFADAAQFFFHLSVALVKLNSPKRNVFTSFRCKRNPKMECIKIDFVSLSFVYSVNLFLIFVVSARAENNINSWIRFETMNFILSSTRRKTKIHSVDIRMFFVALLLISRPKTEKKNQSSSRKMHSKSNRIDSFFLSPFPCFRTYQFDIDARSSDALVDHTHTHTHIHACIASHFVVFIAVMFCWCRTKVNLFVSLIRRIETWDVRQRRQNTHATK